MYFFYFFLITILQINRHINKPSKLVAIMTNVKDT